MSNTPIRARQQTLLLITVISFILGANLFVSWLFDPAVTLTAWLQVTDPLMAFGIGVMNYSLWREDRTQNPNP